ncbi:MAG: WG repeat-containing protein, partial [Saprospiraceae bacterium]
MASSLFKIRQHGRFGFMNAEAEIVIEPQYLAVGEFQQGFCPVRFNDQWVLMDTLGRLYLKKLYRQIMPFAYERARVQVVQRWGYLDMRGNEVISARFDDAGDFSEGLAYVGIHNFYGFINPAGDLVLPMKYE